ncbi:hypothetical protein JCM16408A_52640 [Methylobacterium phyllosphaerae]
MACYTAASSRKVLEAFATPHGTVAGKRATTGDRGPVPLGSPVTPRPGGRVRVGAPVELVTARAGSRPTDMPG